MPIHPSDPWHVLLDALSALRGEIENGATPWSGYDSDPADDLKATAEGYEEVLLAAEKLVSETLVAAPPIPVSTAPLTVDSQGSLTLRFGRAQYELRYEDELVCGYYDGPDRTWYGGRYHSSLFIEAAADDGDVTEIETKDYTSWLANSRLQYVIVQQLDDRDGAIKEMLEFLTRDALVQFRNDEHSRVGQWVFANDGSRATGYASLNAAIAACSW